MTVHDLKCWPEAFGATVAGRKHHEFRRADREFQVGDLLLLREWNPDRDGGDYTGRMAMVRITYLSRGPEWEIPEGYVAMSVEHVRLELARP